MKKLNDLIRYYKLHSTSHKQEQQIEEHYYAQITYELIAPIPVGVRASTKLVRVSEEDTVEIIVPEEFRGEDLRISITSLDYKNLSIFYPASGSYEGTHINLTREKVYEDATEDVYLTDRVSIGEIEDTDPMFTINFRVFTPVMKTGTDVMKDASVILAKGKKTDGNCVVTFNIPDSIQEGDHFEFQAYHPDFLRVKKTYTFDAKMSRVLSITPIHKDEVVF